MTELAAWVIVFALPLCFFVAYETWTGNRHPALLKPEKRTYLFEDDEGNPFNPFGEIGESAEATEPREYRYEVDDLD